MLKSSLYFQIFLVYEWTRNDSQLSCRNMNRKLPKVEQLMMYPTPSLLAMLCWASCKAKQSQFILNIHGCEAPMASMKYFDLNASPLSATQLHHGWWLKVLDSLRLGRWIEEGMDTWIDWWTDCTFSFSQMHSFIDRFDFCFRLIRLDWLILIDSIDWLTESLTDWLTSF